MKRMRIIEFVVIGGFKFHRQTKVVAIFLANLTKTFEVPNFRNFQKFLD